MQRLRVLLFRQNTGTSRLAVAVGIGVFIGLTPLYGLHSFLGIGLAWLMRLNITVTVLATQIANPLFAPFLIVASAWLGNVLDPDAVDGARWWDPTREGFFMSWLRGGLVLGLALGLIAGILTFLIVSRVRRHRHA